MTKRHLVLSALICTLCTFIPAFAQKRVDSRHTYERIYCVVPIIGKGTFEDPRRPQYAPAPDVMSPKARPGILGYHFEESDDHKFALVEFVAANRAALKDILADTKVKAFLTGRDRREDLEAEFKRLKKDFDFDHFGVYLP